MLNIRGSPPVTYNLISLRRHYPVQVIGYYLSLSWKHPGNSVVCKRSGCKVSGKEFNPGNIFLDKGCWYTG